MVDGEDGFADRSCAADENPTWVANRLLAFFGADPQPLPSIDLSYLIDKVTLG